MYLWENWMHIVCQLRGACKRTKTFMWMIVCIAGMSIRAENGGMTSIVRSMGLLPKYYNAFLRLMKSSALCIDKLTELWTKIVLTNHPSIVKLRGRVVLTADGIKIGKSGKKMPSVKKLHQESESNTKPKYILGHSIQVISVLTNALSSVFAIPLIGRIHQGLIFSNRDKRTLLDKMVIALDSLNINIPLYFLADSYYASGKIIKKLLKRNAHLITRAKLNSTAYEKPKQDKKPKRGRKKKYGKKVFLRSFFNSSEIFYETKVKIYGNRCTKIKYLEKDLLWKPVGIIVRFVLVIHPTKGKCIFMTTDTSLTAKEIVQIYALRFKIETSFKQAKEVVGTFSYRFWMKNMKTKSRRSKNQYLHKESSEYRRRIKSKMDEYHRHIQIGFISQGIMQIISACQYKNVWKYFGSWIRTIRPGIPPSEKVTSTSLRNSLPEFLSVNRKKSILAKFLSEKIDIERSEGRRMII